MKIKIICEGQTEEGLRTLLRKAVAIPSCGILIKTYEGIAALLRGLDDAIASELRSRVKVVFRLVDYHHYPLPEAVKNLPLEKRLAAIKADIVQRIDKLRRSVLRCHVVVHEVEAWILADEQVLAQRLKIKRLSPWKQPENVNDMKSPAKILDDLFRTRLKKRYDKYKDGVDLLQRVDWEKIYIKCPTFKQLIDDLRAHCRK